MPLLHFADKPFNITKMTIPSLTDYEIRYTLFAGSLHENLLEAVKALFILLITNIQVVVVVLKSPFFGLHLKHTPTHIDKY